MAAAPAEGESHTNRVVIQPPRGWTLINFREVWQQRELLYQLTKRDIKVRYKQTVLGTAWTLLQPVVNMLANTLIIGYVMNVRASVPEGLNYPVFMFSGMLPWSLFSGALTGASMSLLTSNQLVTKIYLPRLIIPIAAVGVNVVNLCISMVVLLLMMVYFNVPLSPGVVLLPFLIVLINVASLAVGIGLSALAVKYRDVRQLIPHLVQTWMLLTPVLYPVEIVPAQHQWLLSLNPMAGYIAAFRFCLFGHPFPLWSLAISILVTLVGLMASLFYFRRAEANFADII